MIIGTPESGIVKDGLQLWFEMPNSNTHSGGANIYDLSGNGNDTSITGTVTMLDASPELGYPQKRMNMPGGEYTSFSCPQIASSPFITVEMVAMFRENHNEMPFGFNAYDVWTYNGELVFNNASSLRYGFKNDSLWYNKNTHFAFVMGDSNYDITYNKMYVNGEQQSLTQYGGTQNLANQNFNSGNGRISGWAQDSNYRMNQAVYAFRIYDRELSADEIKQNYKASAGKYGLHTPREPDYLVIHDQFSGSGSPDGRTPDTVNNGSTWTAYNGETYSVFSGYVYSTNDSGDFSKTLDIDCKSNKFRVEAQIFSDSMTTQAECGVSFYTTDATDGSEDFCKIDTSGSNFRLVEYSSGSATITNLTSASVLTNNVYHWFILTSNGTSSLDYAVLSPDRSTTLISGTLTTTLVPTGRVGINFATTGNDKRCGDFKVYI